MQRSPLTIGVALLAGLWLTMATLPQTARAQAEPAPGSAPAPGSVTASGRAAPAEGPLTVAVIDFETGDTQPSLGRDIREALTAVLSAEDLALVEREDLQRSLNELALNQTGLVDAQQAVEVGRLVGAKVIVTGRAFPVGEQMFITARLIGTETSRVTAVLVKGDPAEDLAGMLMELAEQVAQRLGQAGERGLLAAEKAADDPMPRLTAAFAGRTRPVVAVVVVEEDLTPAPQPLAAVPDPAVETEIKHLLRAAGFEIQDVRQNELADWARTIDPQHVDSWPRQLAKADLVLTGEAFSEATAPIGRFVPASARAEINLIDRRTGKVLYSSAATTRGVDLTANISGKKALQKAGRQLGLEVLSYLARTLPEAEE